MDPPSKKRSIFGFTGLFRSSPAPADDRDANKADRPIKTTAPAPAQREFNSASAPHSPVKRASESQLAARKIIGRPQGPSSKLSQSISASDISHLPSRTVAATPRRMPGDNPNKLPPSLSTSAVSHAPASNPKASSFSGVPPTPRNLFRSSALYSRPGLSTFSPRVPPNPLTQSFPPTTPGRAPRGSTADVNGRILANTTSSELFKMRIPSPPRHLTGEMLAREVPDDPNRPGSIYADEFLAHYCPPDFDEHQRRQFFCILDLRRLKYAADEVFTKKDWKINILNFAKEYEKSRSLIMLRYGLYEFKTVRPSEAVKKEWKQKHGIPDSDDESDFVPKTNGASKRKAEEGLTPSSSALTASASGGNKRARAPESPAKNKRKATAEPDENHPAKLQKPAPTSQKAPSATKSVFESIANKAQQDVSATPVPPAGKSSLFASSTGPKPNGSIGRSFLDVAPKPAATTGNIFDRLSDASKGSGNEGADEESETSSNAEEDQSEAQDVSQSDEQMASGGASTPRFAEAKKVTLNGTSSASSEAGESTQGRSLFERITRGVDGQPIRKLPPEDGGVFAGSASRARSASPTKDQPAVAPANNTWNENTPIKFKTPAPVFGSTTAVPAGSSAIDFGASKAEPIPVPAPPPAPAEAPKQLASQNLFGAVAKKTEEVSSTSGAPPKAAAPSAFPSFSAKTPDTAAAPGIFGAVKPLITAGPSLFGSAAPAFGQRKDEEVKKPEAAPAAAPSTIFEAKPAAAATEAPKPSIFQSTTSGLFANQSKAEPAPATQPQLGSLFAKPQTAETQAEKPAPSLFSAASAKPASSIFGAAPAAASTEEPAAKKFAFGNGENKSGSLFGSATSTAAPEPAKPAGMANIFAATSTPASGPATKSIFGSTPAAPATEAKGIFGTAAAPAAQGSKPVFGSTSGATETKPGGLFANPPAPAPAPSATPIFSFGSSQTPAASQQAPQPSGSIFGAGASTSFTFSAGGSDGTTIKNPFAADGSYSAPSSFNFGSGDTQPSTSPFGFGAGTAPTISFGGVPDSGGSAAQQTNAFGSTPGPIFNFGAAPQPSGPSLFQQNPPAASSIFGSSLAPGGGTSTGTNSPFTFGGASSLATTPAATTPEPSGNAEEGQGTNADGDEAPQEQISLTDGGPGEEDESVVHEVRAKAVKLVTGGDSDEESGSNADRDKKKKSPWKVQGIGPLRVLKHKTTGAVRMLLRAEPRGHVALNKAVLPDFTYKAEPSGSKYVKVTTASEDGKGLETWMLQVKTPAAAQALAECLEEHKKANKK